MNSLSDNNVETITINERSRLEIHSFRASPTLFYIIGRNGGCASFMEGDYIRLTRRTGKMVEAGF